MPRTASQGPLASERFGDGELEGWSALQFIETHADEVFGRCFVDIVSCKSFDPGGAPEVARDFFGGTPSPTVRQR